MVGTVGSGSAVASAGVGSGGRVGGRGSAGSRGCGRRAAPAGRSRCDRLARVAAARPAGTSLEQRGRQAPCRRGASGGSSPGAGPRPGGTWRRPSASRAPVAGSAGRVVPWTRPIRAPGMNTPSECLPAVTTRAGSRASSWRRRYGAQAAISSGCGSRLPGGRHFTTFVMKTSSRCQPTDSMSSVSSRPAAPTNGRPGLVLVAARALADERRPRSRGCPPPARSSPGSRGDDSGCRRGPPRRWPRAPAPRSASVTPHSRWRRRAAAGGPSPGRRAARRSPPRSSRRPCAGCR